MPWENSKPDLNLCKLDMKCRSQRTSANGLILEKVEHIEGKAEEDIEEGNLIRM
jgi:hypothetical protein